MYGYYGLAAALFTTLALIGAGASDTLMDNLNQQVTGTDEERQAYGEEELVEGHITYATLTIEEKTVVHRDTTKDVHCTETNPTDPVWPIFETCEVTVGPIGGNSPLPSIEEVHADVDVQNNGVPVVGNPDEGFWDTLFSLIPHF